MTSIELHKPNILVVDDEPDRVRNDMTLGLRDRATLTVVDPDKVTKATLDAADLLLVDYKLDYWFPPDQPPDVRQIQSGFGLAPILRQTLDARPDGRFAAVVLHTAHLTEASRHVRVAHRQKLISQLHGFDWVIDKGRAERFDQIMLLAQASRALRVPWPDDLDAAGKHLQDLLGMDGTQEWVGQCFNDLRQCQPPVVQLSCGASPSLLIRWLLRDILPYPCFLWDIHSVAARLRVSHSDLDEILSSDSPLAKELGARKYTGLLADFFGMRWWRGAVEQYVWKLLDESSRDADSFARLLAAKADRELDVTARTHSLVHLDANLKPIGVASPSEVVRLRPDHWPPYADAAWAKVADVTEDFRLLAMLDPLDEYRIPRATRDNDEPA